MFAVLFTIFSFDRKIFVVYIERNEMPKLELEPFHRALDGDQEPTDHQRKFLYLPLPIFRDYTNIRSIIINHTHRKNGKLTEFIIKKKIEACHSKLGELGEWKNLHLDKLEFKWDESGVQQ